jgi:hypothetical protein
MKRKKERNIPVRKERKYRNEKKERKKYTGKKGKKGRNIPGVLLGTKDIAVESTLAIGEVPCLFHVRVWGMN